MIISINTGCVKDGSGSKDSSLMSLEEKYFEDYVAPSSKWGFIDESGETIIEAIYDDVLPYSEGLAGVNYKGRWGFLNKAGDLSIKPQYMSVTSFKDDHAIARDFNGLYGLIDKNGNVSVDFEYENIASLEKVFVFSKGRMKGIFDEDGNVIITPSYTSIRSLSETAVAVKDNKAWFTIDLNNPENTLCGPYEELFEYSDGLAAVQVNGKWGFMNKECTVEIEPLYTFAESFHKGHAPIMKDDLYYLINKKGEIASEGYNFIQWLNGAWGAQSEGSWKLISSNGEVLKNREFDTIYSFSEGLAPALTGDRWGYIDTIGNLQIPGVFVIPWQFREGKARIMTSQGMQFLGPTGDILPIGPRYEYRDFSEGMAAFKE